MHLLPKDTGYLTTPSRRLPPREGYPEKLAFPIVRKICGLFVWIMVYCVGRVPSGRLGGSGGGGVTLKPFTYALGYRIRRSSTQFRVGITSEIVMFNLLDRLVGRCVAALLTIMFGYIAFTSVALALVAIFM